MKKIALLLFTFCLSFSGFSQNDDTTSSTFQTRFGIKAGYNGMQMKNVIDGSESIRKSSGFYVGGYINIPTSDQFSVQPEVIYSSTEYLYNDQMNLLQIPVKLQFKMANNFRGFIGPEGIFLVGLGDQDKALFKEFLFAVTFGITYEITDQFHIEIRPSLSLTKFFDDGIDYRRFNTLQVGLAYEF